MGRCVTSGASPVLSVYTLMESGVRAMEKKEGKKGSGREGKEIFLSPSPLFSPPNAFFVPPAFLCVED